MEQFRMPEFQGSSLQSLVGECRKLLERHQKLEVRSQAEELINEYLVLVTRPLTLEELEAPQEELRLKMAKFVESNQILPS